MAPLLIFSDPFILLGFTLILVLLICLLVMRMTVSRQHARLGPSLAHQATQEYEAPELPGRSINSRSTVPADGPTPWMDPGSTQPPFNQLQVPVPTVEQAESEETRDKAKAARMWSRLARWRRAAECYIEVGAPMKAANILLALDRSAEALPLIKEEFGKSPLNESIRLRYIETLLDLGNAAEAKELAYAVSEEQGDGPMASARFFEAVARHLESSDFLEDAETFYNLALRLNDSLPEVDQRVQFIRHLNRLSNPEEAEQSGRTDLKALLSKYTDDSANIPLELVDEDIDLPESKTDIKKPPPANAQLAGHEVIVGHLALGFQRPEPTGSVRSVYALSRRFLLEQVINESERFAVFKARDCLLDFPVALKLYRLPNDFVGIDSLRDRLLAVAHLNHPNLAKITFADREGPILRIATEFLPGGNLGDFLRRLGGVGLPLAIRMAMHVSSALHTAHLRGVPHGDVRPENLLIGTDQRIKIIDFALSAIPVSPRESSLDDVDLSELDLDISDKDKNLNSEAIRSDILQFADVLQFLLDHARVTTSPVGNASTSNDAVEELRELVSSIRNNSFTTILGIWQVLQEIFERALPADSHPENQKVDT